jgi:hypothetical protein
LDASYGFKLDEEVTEYSKSTLKLFALVWNGVGMIICAVGIQDGDNTVIMALIVHILAIINASEFIIAFLDFINPPVAPEMAMTV